MTARRPAATSWLVDAVTNPQDPGYAQAAARHAGPPSRIDRLLVLLGCLLAGFTLALAYTDTHRAAPHTASVHAALVRRVREAQETEAQLQRSANRLAAAVNAARDQALGGSEALRSDLRRAQGQAGTLAVSGPGIVVRLADPPASSPTPQPGGSPPVSAGRPGLLTDRDVRSVVNELWADGAEAVSVNDVRLTAGSAIRYAGQAVLVDFQPIASPYVVRAVGNRDDLVTRLADSPVASRYQTLAAARGIGFTFTEATSLALPAVITPVLRYATPLGPAPR